MEKSSFKFTVDYYKGVHVDMRDDQNSELIKPELFVETLERSIEGWKKKKFRLMWFYLPISISNLIKPLHERKFQYHHAKKDVAVLYRWMFPSEKDLVPDFSRCRIGVGGLCVDFKTKQVLMIQEKWTSRGPYWKCPGGALDRNESIQEAAQREVREETGVESEFVDFLGFRYAWDLWWPTSAPQDDIYFVCLLSATSKTIHSDEDEISKCKWVPFEEFFKKKFIGTVNYIREAFKEYYNNISTKISEDEGFQIKRKLKEFDNSWKGGFKNTKIKSRWYQI